MNTGTPQAIDRDRLSASMDRITSVLAALRNTGLTEQQAQYMLALENEHRDIREVIQPEHLVSNISHTTQTIDNQSVPSDDISISGTRVLLVEDDAIIRTIALNIFKRTGAEVTIAENGKIAAELTALNKYDIILMDIQMPVMDGLQASRIIRHEQKSTTPIVGLTANAIQNADKYFEAGMNDVMAKPYSHQKLVNTIYKWINQQITNNIETINETINSDASSLFSLKKLQEIGDESFVRRMLHLFVDQASTAIPDLRKAYNENDFAAVRYIIHRMRPSVLNMGITSLQTEIVEIEELAKNNESSPILNEMISKLESVISQVTTEIRKLLA